MLNRKWQRLVEYTPNRKIVKMSREKSITATVLKAELKVLIHVFGGAGQIPPDQSIEELLGILKVLAVYRRFDLEAIKRELKHARREG